ncbi:MAG TPA: tetratricopeptide repeat protein [Saprospiraceae bacterium]|nr:tetratricopeptide repeat protein [Saprospiraceae bacterium]HMQ83690.1 tetratricopeptide repeat protein [Saprospiraceae bacterium]
MTNSKHSKKSLTKAEMLDRHQRGAWYLAEETYDEFSRKAMKGLKYHDSQEALPETFRRLEQKMGIASKPVARTIHLKPVLAVAASVALLVLAGLFLWQNNASSDQLFANHFDYLPSAIQNNEGDTDVRDAVTGSKGTLKDQVLSAYGNGQYEQALTLMEQYRQVFPEDKEMAFYQAILYLGQGEENQAVVLLESMTDDLPRKEYQRAHEHYLAMAYLKVGTLDKAKPLFLQLKSGNDRYARMAAEILKQWPTK